MNRKKLRSAAFSSEFYSRMSLHDLILCSVYLIIIRKETCTFERLVADPQDVIRDPQVDAIFLCTPTSTRDALLIAILDVRKHLYVEKPLAPTFEAVRKLCHKGAQASVVVQVGFQFRWNSMYAKLQQLIEGREMGLLIC